MTPDPTHELTALQHRERELTAGLEAAHRRKDFTRRDLDDARNRAAGFKHSEHPQDKGIFKEATAKAAELQEILRVDLADIAALERDLSEVRVEAAGLFAGKVGHQNALAIYRRAKADAAKAGEAARALAGQRTAAVQDLAEAKKALDLAAAAHSSALDPATVAKTRAALAQAQREVDDADALLANLKHHSGRLQTEQDAARAAAEEARKRVFSTQASRLAEEFKQQALGPALEAFAAARLAGSGWSFREFVADALDPDREFIPPAAEARQAALVAELECLGTKEIDHA